MTVRELINILINYDADETIDFYLGKNDDDTLEISDCAYDRDLPWIEFKKK